MEPLADWAHDVKQSLFGADERLGPMPEDGRDISAADTEEHFAQHVLGLSGLERAHLEAYAVARLSADLVGV